MPVMQFKTSVGAASSNTNFLNGSNYEFARQRQVVSIGVTAAAVDTFITIQSGSDVLLEESPPYVLTNFPTIPDHMFYNDVMENGDRLKISCRNPTGAAVIHYGIVQVNPL